MTHRKKGLGADRQSRRDFLASTATASVLGALAAAGYSRASKAAMPAGKKASARALAKAPKAPFDSLRDWVAAMDAHGLLMHFDRIDQDAYEIPALFFQATDMYTMYGAPCFMFDQVEIDGQWVDGPVLINTQGQPGVADGGGAGRLCEGQGEVW